MKTLAKKKTKATSGLPKKAEASIVPNDATVELPELLPEEKALSNEEKAPATQEFNAVKEEKEAPLYELVRTSSGGYIKACKKLSWFSAQNTHLVVYTMFFLVLAVFGVYYGFFQQDKMLCIFSFAAAAFMLYIVICGPRLFASGMAFDEERAEGTLSCMFFKDKLEVILGEEKYSIPYTSVTRLSFVKHCIYIRVKNSKEFPSGIIMEKPTSKDAVKEISELIKNREAK